MLEWGVVNRVVAADDLVPKARAFAERLAARPDAAHAATKRMIRLAVDEGVEAADAALPEAGAKVMASEDLQSGARTLLEKGPGHATFKGRLTRDPVGSRSCGREDSNLHGHTPTAT